ncbi:hypothetical protein BCR36DRAFT_276387 [Piromyces finnis]|uniref:Uncharacterized protein n=1 Tax=Piromyces finnis TaxID=1754191 RepID=A0A1Y1VKL0_9FUNG|nr:hypothetical protein BCR36DRAFT_276387 [Piromyces finnis]|eukprot:ORX58585.1 hypothetical protein BCR36DRAFT_276387 [Piromyces finnis]
MYIHLHFIYDIIIVYCVSAKSDFIGSGRKRPELFELTDNEVAEFRLTIPEVEFDDLKEQSK